MLLLALQFSRSTRNQVKRQNQSMKWYYAKKNNIAEIREEEKKNNEIEVDEPNITSWSNRLCVNFILLLISFLFFSTFYILSFHRQTLSLQFLFVRVRQQQQNYSVICATNEVLVQLMKYKKKKERDRENNLRTRFHQRSMPSSSLLAMESMRFRMRLHFTASTEQDCFFFSLTTCFNR